MIIKNVTPNNVVEFTITHTHFYMSFHEEKNDFCCFQCHFFANFYKIIANGEPWSKEIQLPSTDNINIC